MNPPRLIAALCLLLALAALLYAMFSDATAFEPGSPRTTAGPIPLLAASVPAIGDLKSEFDVNNENPFVPANVRGDEKLAMRAPKRDTKVVIPPPGPSVTVDSPAKTAYPALKPRDAGAPECFGVVRKDDAAVLVARLPGKEEKVDVKVGDVLGGWTLLEISVGMVRFQDPAGEIHDLPIGSIATPQTLDQPTAASLAPQPATAKPAAAPATQVVPRVAAPLRPGPNQPPANPRRQGNAALQPGNGLTPVPAPELVPLRPKPK